MVIALIIIVFYLAAYHLKRRAVEKMSREIMSCIDDSITNINIKF
jgi:hypothetical protein